MDDLDHFLENYRHELLERSTGFDFSTHRKSSDNAKSRQFVQHVIDAWSKLPPTARRSPIRRGERAFWYALYTMEDLTELSVDGNLLDPFESLLIEELARARQLLETRADLPEGKFAARPNRDRRLTLTQRQAVQ